MFTAIANGTVTVSSFQDSKLEFFKDCPAALEAKASLSPAQQKSFDAMSAEDYHRLCTDQFEKFFNPEFELGKSFSPISYAYQGVERASMSEEEQKEADTLYAQAKGVMTFLQANLEHCGVPLKDETTREDKPYQRAFFALNGKKYCLSIFSPSQSRLALLGNPARNTDALEAKTRAIYGEMKKAQAQPTQSLEATPF